MALGKLDGVDKVDVTLKRGVANITLKPGNSLTLARLRQTVKDAGYTSGEAVATATGRISPAGRQKVLSVTGTSMSWVIEPMAGSAAAVSLAGAEEGSTVQVTGSVSPGTSSGPDRIMIRELTRVR